ncbi:MAG: YkvA family protein [Spirochaetales bacterium]|nr:YkvA family protein [Spirochaetales bacterium]
MNGRTNKPFTFKDAENFARKNPEFKNVGPKKILENSGAIIRKLDVVYQTGVFVSNIKTLLVLVKAYATKEYTKVPKKTMLSICFALFYFFSPVDAIPDNIPGVGYIDDMAVIQRVLKAANDDISEFKQWEEEQTKAA